MSNIESVRKRFGEAHEQYALCKVQSADFTLTRVVELTRPQPHWIVVDVASGAGHTTAAFAPHVTQVIAIDVTEEMLRQTAKIARDRGLTNVVTLQAEASSLPLPSGSVHLVTCRLAVHHFEDPAAFIAEAHRILMPGGILAVVDSHLPPNAALDEINRIQKIHDPSHVACLTRVAFESCMKKAEFALCALEEGKVRLGFRTWTKRVGLSDDICRELRRLMTEVPSPDTATVLDVRCEADEEFTFSFQRIILIGQKV